MRLLSNFLGTTSLVLLTAFATAPLKAADLDVTSAIDAVTVYPDGASVTRVITLDLPSGDNTLVAKDFPLTLDPSSLRVEGEAGAKLTIGAIDARPPRQVAAGQSARDRQAHRGIAGSARRSRRRDRRRDSAPQIRRALRRGLSGWTGRKGRGASARRMARGLRGGRRRGRQSRYRDPRRAAQAARYRPRDRAARAGPQREASEQARGPHRSRGGGFDEGDAAGHLCGAACALDADLRCPPRHRSEGPQAVAGTGAPRRDRADRPARTGRT